MVLDAVSRQSVAHDLRRQDGRLDLLVWRSLASVIQRTAVVLAAGVVLISGVAFAAPEASTPITSSEDGLSPRAAMLNPNADPDGDGLSNQFEASFGGVFNPNEPDTDHDDLRDEEEFNKRYGDTSPNVWDSDGDGIGDGQEVFGHYDYVTRPDVWDTDGDGRSDGVEIFDTNPHTSPVEFER